MKSIWRPGPRVGALLGAMSGVDAALPQEATDAGDLWDFDELDEVDPGFLELAANQAPEVMVFTENRPPLA